MKVFIYLYYYITAETLQTQLRQPCRQHYQVAWLIIVLHIFFLINLQCILFLHCFSGVGKSRLVIKYIKNALHRNEEPTIAVSFFTCNIILDDVKIKLQVSTTKRYEAPTFSLIPSPSHPYTCFLLSPCNPIYFINGLSVQANLSFCCHWDSSAASHAVYFVILRSFYLLFYYCNFCVHCTLCFSFSSLFLSFGLLFFIVY